MRVGHVHEAGFYSSEDEFRALIVPFVEEGLAHGEPVVIGYDDHKSALLRSWLADASGVAFVSDRSLYSSPAKAIAEYRRLFERHVGEGARRIRIAGDVPHAGNGGRFDGWDRYEAAVNAVWEDFPVRSVCLYDATTVTPEVRDVVERTHPHLVTPLGERFPSGRYEDPASFVGLPAEPDPLEATEPLVELSDPAPAEARHAVERVARAQVAGVVVDDLVLGISEATSNARIHGLAPTTVRIWAGRGRVVVHVHDSGPGPRDRLAGLMPVADSVTRSGLGLWLTHQLDLDVALIAGPDGFTVRLRGGRAPGPRR
ncbi:sensor histidine kinase [Prauserella flavalba]|uniref:Anti-sigma regulatory factor (Ser/Thr protein kinase) n=1 Tax=Prauserella flavalba TaxID=1477506 RepID=A0A318LJJ8_9PSEU|nr:sensor histidine kinase [Prauserella flavalba]PXY30789.1 hypothetical protein BA062_19835 [Prauserella flavalba]